MEIKVADLHEITKISLKMVNNSPYAVLIVPGDFTTFSKNARDLGASTELPGDRVATALVANSLSYKLISNFYLKFNKPNSPTKVFSSRDHAIIWLKQSMGADERYN